MNFEELSALDAAAQVGLDGLGTKPTVQISLSMQENRVHRKMNRLGKRSMEQQETRP